MFCLPSVLDPVLDVCVREPIMDPAVGTVLKALPVEVLFDFV